MYTNLSSVKSYVNLVCIGELKNFQDVLLEYERLKQK